MAIRKGLVRSVVFVAVTVAFATAVSIGVLSRVYQRQPRPETLPQIFSKVKNLEVIKATIIDAHTPAARVQIEIWNHSSLAVMAVDVVCGDGAITRNGLTDEEHPIVVIEPYGTTTIEMGFGEMTPGAPLVVSAVTYADGTEEGEQQSLRLMHKIREHDRAKIRAEREHEKGGGKR